MPRMVPDRREAGAVVLFTHVCLRGLRGSERHGPNPLKRRSGGEGLAAMVYQRTHRAPSSPSARVWFPRCEAELAFFPFPVVPMPSPRT